MDFKDRNKQLYILYELLGSCLLMIGVNFGFGSLVLTCISLWSWELSAAHFNWGLTLCEIFMEYKNVGEYLKPAGIIIVVQFVGALLGIFFTYIQVNYQYANFDEFDTYDVVPSPPTLCPSLTLRQSQKSPELTGCNIQGLAFKIFVAEFLQSFIFYLSWIIIRKYDIGPSCERFGNLMKPFLVVAAYTGSMIFSTTYGGKMNPTMAMG